MLPHFPTHFSLCKSMNSPFISSLHAYASYHRDRSALAPSLHSRSPTLPLDEDADGETGQEKDNKEFTSMYDTASHEHRDNIAGKARTRRLQDGKSKVGRVLKPVSSRTSKQSIKGRGIRRRTPQKQHEAKRLSKKTRNSQKTRPVERQDSNFTPPATFPIHQADQPGNINNQPNAPDQKVQSHRASINLHPEGVQRATRSRARALESKLSTKRNAESLASRSRRSPAQRAQRSKLEKRRKSPPEHKTRSGRVSKRPKRFGFT